MAKGLLTNVKTSIQNETLPRFHMDKKEIDPRLPQAPETIVSIIVCSCFKPYPFVYLSSNEEGVARNPMVYPSSYGEGLRVFLYIVQTKPHISPQFE